MSIRGLTMNEEDTAKLRRLLLLAGDAALPERCVETYWRFKAASDRLGCGLGDLGLIVIAELSGGVKVRAFTIIDAVERKLVKPGDTVLCSWRGDILEGTFASLAGRGKDVRVQVTIGSETRQLAPSEVTMKE